MKLLLCVLIMASNCGKTIKAQPALSDTESTLAGRIKCLHM
jgi:hypothetical protein